MGSICPDLSDNDCLLGPFYNFSDDKKTFTFKVGAASLAATERLFHNFNPKKITCEESARHSGEYLLVH